MRGKRKEGIGNWGWWLNVEGRFDSVGSALENMSVDHGGFDVFVPE